VNGLITYRQRYKSWVAKKRRAANNEKLIHGMMMIVKHTHTNKVTSTTSFSIASCDDAVITRYGKKKALERKYERMQQFDSKVVDEISSNQSRIQLTI
jgi:hypothetical protein